MSLRIGIDYRPALLLRSGIGRYVANLVRHLPEADEELTLSLFSVFWKNHEDRLARADLPSTERVKLAAAKFPGRILDFLGKFTPLSVETWAKQLDLFHFTDYVHLPVKTEPVVFTVHDVSFLRSEDFHGPKSTRQLVAVTTALVERSTLVLAVSETTRNDVIEHLGVPEERVVVTPLGVDEVFLEPQPRTPQERPYILALGTIEPRKNIARLLDAVERIREGGLDATLLLAGRRGWMCDDVFAALERPALQGCVRYLGEVSDSALVTLMHNATVLAYPSLWEGFGLPILEGMATGIPVLTSDLGAMKEVAGDGAHLVDPTSVEEIAAGLTRLISDDGYREEVARRGRARAATFTWAECARRTAAAYRLALERHRHGDPPG